MGQSEYKAMDTEKQLCFRGNKQHEELPGKYWISEIPIFRQLCELFDEKYTMQIAPITVCAQMRIIRCEYKLVHVCFSVAYWINKDNIFVKTQVWSTRSHLDPLTQTLVLLTLGTTLLIKYMYICQKKNCTNVLK